jgi:hypothetical protein
MRPGWGYHARPTPRVPDIVERASTPAITLLAVGSTLIAAARLADPLLGHSSGFGWKEAAVLTSGAVAVVAAIVLTPLPVDRERPPQRSWLLWLGIASMGVLVLWSRLGSLNQSLWHDEIYSVVHYVHTGPTTIISGGYVPNDHVLFNLLNYGTTQVLGESEVTLRLWSVLPALAAAATIVWWAWRELGPWTAVVLAVLVATSPVHHDLAREARGYGLLFLAGAFMLVFSYRVAVGGSTRAWVLLGLAGVVGAFTAPQFALGFVGQSVPLLVRPDLRKRALLMLGAVALVLGLLYAPLLGDIAGSPETVSGGPLPWHGVVSGPAQYLLQPSFDLLAGRPTDAYQIVASDPDRILAGVLALIGAIVLWRARARMLCALLVVPVLFVYSVLTLARFHVHERYGSFLLFHALVLGAIGIIGLVRVLPRGVPRYAAGSAAAAIGTVMLMQTIDHSDRFQELPRENFKQVAKVVRAHGESKIVTDSTRPDGLRYYLGQQNMTVLPSAVLEESLCSASPPAVFVEHPYRSSGENPPPDVGCLARRGAVRVRVSQRDRGGHIDVWVASG